jgi:hypothetical protein
MGVLGLGGKKGGEGRGDFRFWIFDFGLGATAPGREGDGNGEKWQSREGARDYGAEVADGPGMERAEGDAVFLIRRVTPK